MLGAITGDIIGSVYERKNIKTTDFPLFQENSRFTDDTILTVAVADAILNDKSYLETIKFYARKFPYAGYGKSFKRWMISWNDEPYNSCGNGSAMRVSPVAWSFDSVGEVLAEAEKSAAVTHNHPEGIKGAQAIALAIFLARKGESKQSIKQEITGRFSYDLERTLDDIRPVYRFDVTCQGSVPESIIAFLESNSFEDAIRKAVSIGGDSDTIACICGSIAEAYYGGIPDEIRKEAMQRLNEPILQVVYKFYEVFILNIMQKNYSLFVWK